MNDKAVFMTENQASQAKRLQPNEHLVHRPCTTLALVFMFCLFLPADAAQKPESRTVTTKPTNVASTTESKMATPTKFISSDISKKDTAINTSDITYLNIAGLLEPNSTSVPVPSNQLTRQLWVNRIVSPTAEENTPTSRDLRRLIEQVRSVRFEPQYSATPSMVPTEQNPFRLPNNRRLATQLPQDLRNKMVNSNDSELMQPQALTDQTVKIVDSLLPHPEQVRNPFEIAEMLFTCSRLKEAAVFYQQALSKIRPDDTQSAENRAWLLFQVANCLRESNSSTAKDTYMKLISEYPNSPWTEIARVRGKLLGWYEKNDLKKILAEPKS
jgi:hypothetical protein